MRTRRGKTLTAADLALWREVARSVKPLPGRSAPLEDPAPAPIAALPSPALPVIVALSPQPRTPAPPPPLAPLERRLRTRLRRGQETVEAVLDLHGLRQEEAHAALRGFLRGQQMRGTRLTLIITGKGAAGMDGFGDERGVLKRCVPHWLRLPDLRPLVLGFEEAEQRHGGAGALYVRLRRAREFEP